MHCPVLYRRVRTDVRTSENVIESKRLDVKHYFKQIRLSIFSPTANLIDLQTQGQIFGIYREILSGSRSGYTRSILQMIARIRFPARILWPTFDELSARPLTRNQVSTGGRIMYVCHFCDTTCTFQRAGYACVTLCIRKWHARTFQRARQHTRYARAELICITRSRSTNRGSSVKCALREGQSSRTSRNKTIATRRRMTYKWRQICRNSLVIICI